METDFQPSRRQFVKMFALGTVHSLFHGSDGVGAVLGEVQPKVAGTVGILKVKLSQFTALQSANGSIRLALNAFNPTVPNPQPYYPILVNRGSGSQFFALVAQCTHLGCVVPTFGNACPCHGSRYAIDGSVILGPAPAPLARYTITYDGNDILTIEVPNLGYSVSGSALQAFPGPRFRLDFPTQSGLIYEVRFRQSVTDAGSVVSFSTAPDGTANQTSIGGNGGTLSVYVDRSTSTGFYTVNVKVTQA